MFGLTKNKVVGLEVDEGFVAACALAKKGRAVGMARYSVGGSLGEIASSDVAKDTPVYIAIPAQVVLFKTFYIPAALGKSKHRQKDIMAFLVRQSLPFKLEECYWDTFIWNNNLTLIAAKREMVEKYMSQVGEAGLVCAGVAVSASALYNVLIYNYPERKNDRCALLHIRNSASDLVLYEPGHLWMYPLSVGKKDFGSPEETAARLSAELQRTFNAHTLQHQQALARPGGYFYVSGRGATPALAQALKQSLPGYQFDMLDPFKKIAGAGPDVQNPSNLALAVGVGLSQLAFGASLTTNMIRGKVSREKSSARWGFLQKASLVFVTLAAAALVFVDAGLMTQLKQQKTSNQSTQGQIDSVLPRVKEIKVEQEKLKMLGDFLEGRIQAQMFYLRVLATLAESKTANVAIKDFSADKKDMQLDVALAGSAAGYNDINDFLANLKKNPDIKNVKVVASTFPQGAQESKPVDFKVRFEVQL